MAARRQLPPPAAHPAAAPPASQRSQQRPRQQQRSSSARRSVLAPIASRAEFFAFLSAKPTSSISSSRTSNAAPSPAHGGSIISTPDVVIDLRACVVSCAACVVLLFLSCSCHTRSVPSFRCFTIALLKTKRTSITGPGSPPFGGTHAAAFHNTPPVAQRAQGHLHA